MRAKTGIVFEKITGKFWIIPALISIGLTALVFFLKSTIIISYNPVVKEIFFLRAEGKAVQLLLSSIATSIMTVLGVVFSVIVVVMAQMSSQHSPRVVSNFTRSTVAQVVLGTYVGTFTYCLILLMNSKTEVKETETVAVIAVAGAFFLAIICLILLIYYIHHVTQSIQSTQIICNISKETIHSLRNTSRDRKENSKFSTIANKNFSHKTDIYSEKVGYIDFIDWIELPEDLNCSKWKIVFQLKAGDYVQKGEKLLTFYSHEPIDQKIKDQLHDIFTIASDRTYSQDFEYGIQKLRDIALRGLSPGINDPSTAIEAINAITTILLEYKGHPHFNQDVRIDAEKSLSFVPIELDELVKENFDHLANFCGDHPNVKATLRRNLELIRKST